MRQHWSTAGIKDDTSGRRAGRGCAIDNNGGFRAAVNLGIANIIDGVASRGNHFRVQIQGIGDHHIKGRLAGHTAHCGSIGDADAIGIDIVNIPFHQIRKTAAGRPSATATATGFITHLFADHQIRLGNGDTGLTIHQRRVVIRAQGKGHRRLGTGTVKIHLKRNIDRITQITAVNIGSRGAIQCIIASPAYQININIQIILNGV